MGDNSIKTGWRRQGDLSGRWLLLPSPSSLTSQV